MTVAEGAQKPELIQRPSIKIAHFPFLRRNVLSNLDIESWGALTADGEPLTEAFIFEKTGVKQRYRTTPDEDVAYMGMIAAVELFPQRDTALVDTIFFATSYPTGVPFANRVREALDIQAETRDFFAACSGFAEILHFVFIHPELTGKRILAIMSEQHSKWVVNLKPDEKAEQTPEVRSRGPREDPSFFQALISDGSFAVLFKNGEDLTILNAETVGLGHSDYITGPFNRHLLTDMYGDFTVEPPDGFPFSKKLHQNGPGVFGTVARGEPKLIDRVVRETRIKDDNGRERGLIPEDIAMIIPHQPGIRLLQKIKEGLENISSGYKDKVFFDIEDGNFSSASIPKALDKAIRERRLKKGDIVVFAGFGAGKLTASTAVVRL